MDEQNESYPRFRRERGWIFIGVGAGFLFFAYLIFVKSSQFTLRLSEHPVTYHRVDYPITFNVAAAAAFLIGVYHLIQGIRLVASKSPKVAKENEVISTGVNSVGWGVFNMAILVLSVWLGYTDIPLEVVREANPKWVLCLSTFVVFVLNVPLWLHFAPASMFRRPEWGRSPLKWSYDPLQFFLIATCCWAGLILGTLSRLFLWHLMSDKTAVWGLFVYVAVLAGLLVGQAIAYTIYRDRIES